MKKVFIISAPSGTGKNTLINRLLQSNPSLAHSISTTTRAPREGEIDGKHYYFVSKDEFHDMVDRGELFEYAPVLSNLYGTTRAELDRLHKLGKTPVLDLDVQGALNVKKMEPATTIVFVKPPSLEVLKERLSKRNTEDDKQMNERLELAKLELAVADRYDHIITNDDLDAAVAELESVIR